MSEESELSLAQRVHLAQRDLKSFLKTPIIAIGIGIVLIGIVIPITLDTRNFLDTFGYFEERLNSADGPSCILEDFSGDEADFPSQVLVIEGLGADKAGIKSGDFITSVNGVPISSTGDVLNWQNLVPGIKPGDNVDVGILRDEVPLSFNVKTTELTDDPTKPMIGINTASSCTFYFILNEGVVFSQADLYFVYNNLDIILLTNGIFGIVLIYFAFSLFGKLKRLRSEVIHWEDAYLDQNYLLTFETNSPQGSTDGEKIFNMAQTVFPELRKSNGKPEKWKGKVVTKDGYEFDCFQPTNVKKDEDKEILVVKHFGDSEITAEKIQEVCDSINKSKKDKSVQKKIENASGMNIFRLIIVGRNYDNKLVKDEGYQDEVLDDLDFDAHIDLILEKDGNYTVILFETD